MSLAFDEQRYWLQVSQYSDELDYQYHNTGYWLWDPYLPEEIIFEMYQETSIQIFNPVQPPSGPPDTLDDGEDEIDTPPDTVRTVRGDNSKLEEVFVSSIEFGDEDETMRLYGFTQYIILGDITLDKN